MTHYQTLDGIRRAAKKRSRALGIPYTRALDLISREANYSDFQQAAAEYAKSAPQPSFPITIFQYWRDRSTRQRGTESLYMSISRPLVDLVRPHHLKGYLSGARIEGADVLIGYGAEDRLDLARRELCRYARALQFMDATGLKPSRGNRGYPRGQWAYRKPNSDHDRVWFDPASRTHVITDEPYPGRTSMDDAEVRRWSEEHGYAVVQCRRHSMYGLGAELYLVGKASGDLDLASLVRKLEQAPLPITEQNAKFGPLKSKADPGSSPG